MSNNDLFCIASFTGNVTCECESHLLRFKSQNGYTLSQGGYTMNTDGGWISISEAAQIYGKSRKWVYDQIKRYQIGTEKTENRTRLRLVDLIAHRGEPQNGAPSNSAPHTEKAQKITPETELLKQENQFLHHRIEELEADKAERQAREAHWIDERTRLQGIIERQTHALQKPQSEGVFSRFVQ